jgi:3-deoxy-D-manno-octulosonic-acid transferase
MTIGGRDAAERRIPEAASVSLAPLDLLPAVRRFAGKIRPRLTLIAETELWPNYIGESHRVGARVAIVNGRMSERSFRAYRVTRRLFAPILGSIEQLLCQTDADAERFIELGARPDCVFVTGNTKMDFDTATELRPELRDFLAGKRILVGGSTARGEDEIVLQAFAELTAKFPDLYLVLAPRHLERLPELEQLLAQRKLSFVRATRLPPDSAAHVLLLDTMGELASVYRHALVAFIGGSMMNNRGGKSPGEAAFAGVPVLIGPHHQNQQELVQALVKQGAGMVVRLAADIANCSLRYLDDESLRRDAGDRARNVALSFSGAVDRTLVKIRNLIGIV